jgi:hypothetical protein
MLTKAFRLGQQSSFGRKRPKQCRAVRWQGIGSFCGRGNEGEGKIIPAQVLAVLQGKGLARKEAFLLTAVLVTFAAPKVTALPAATERADVVGSNEVKSLLNSSLCRATGLPRCARNDIVIKRRSSRTCFGTPQDRLPP